MKLIVVTSCPTGIVHSQVAAENLLQVDKCLSHDIDVEVQGAVDTRDELASNTIAKADTVIVISDTSVNHDHFDDKLVLKGAVEDSVDDAEAVVQKAVELTEAGKTGSATFGSGDDGEDTDVGADDSSDNADTAESDEPVRRGGNPEKGLFTHLEKLLS